MNSWSSQWLYMPVAARTLRMFFIRSFLRYIAHFCWTVRADLFCEPLNVPIEFVADVEVDTGKIMINRL